MRTRLDPSELRDRDLEVGEHLQQHRLELLVGLVDLVDQEHHRLLGGDRRHQRARKQELLAEDVVLDSVPAGAGGLGLDSQQLLAVVPLIQSLRLVQALVALQAHQLAVEVLGQRLGQLGLAHARWALHEDGLAEPRGQEGHERRGLARQVADAAQARCYICDGGGRRGRRGWHRPRNDRRRAILDLRAGFVPRLWRRKWLAKSGANHDVIVLIFPVN